MITTTNPPIRIAALHEAAMATAESRSSRRTAVLSLAVLAGVVAGVPSTSDAAQVPFKSLKMIIEYNATAQDIGVQLFLDADGWRSVRAQDPFGKTVFRGSAKGNVLQQGGGTELFVESEEPPIAEVPLDVFFERFREGTYTFSGHTTDGGSLFGETEFTHEIPAGPVIVAPVQGAVCPTNVAIPVLIDWDPVTLDFEGDPLPIVKYEVIVENATSHLSMHLAGDVTQLTVPAEFFEAGTDYIFEVLAIEAGGNQTITEGCFTTTP